ncbi:enoyl-CoA hydratase/isomerase family protein [Solicola gregarius]|uniref:Enoyl-CoA hydratase/isomerase family protein n=1 Tax=Solicola gregarius TaxID=2908642 RepID=A0AA46TL57_9ACTN|nr:enoyl-CoA hydratase/isomerase family protein [Solicola gregarius]UYM07285.1 enoyl-CoA hydratase/isomerase family protein [Solicola gregarius]
MSDLRVDRPAALAGATRVLIDRPARRNALTYETVRELHDLLGDTSHGTLVLGSASDGIFSAGADLDTDDDTRTRLSDLLYACYERIVTRPGIVLAVVDGPAVGGGAQLCAAADLRIASSRARWRWLGPGHGLAVGAWILPDLIGRSLGLELTLTGRWLGADEAVRSGFVGELHDDPWARTREVAAGLATADADALARTKQAATRPYLLDALSEERRRNAAAWSGRAPER